MASPVISLVNYMATATVTPSTEDVIYVANNAKAPQRPFLPWRTTATSQQTLVCNFGSAKAMRLMAVIRTNYVSLKFQAHTSDSWGSPAYDSGTLTASRNPYTGRYQYIHVPAAVQTYQFLRLVILAQSSVAEKLETPASYFLTGGLWVGDTIALPRPPSWPLAPTVIEPKQDLAPEHDGWSQRLVLGEPRVRLRFKRRGSVLTASPGYTDQLAGWLDLDRQVRNAGSLFFAMNLGDASQGWVMRRESAPEFTADVGRAEGEWTLSEVLGPS